MSAKTIASAIGRSLRDWTWFEILNAWVTQSLSTIAGASFTWCTVWIMLVAGDKPFVIAILHAALQDNARTVDAVKFISFFADSAYIVLPEIIIFGGILRVILFVAAWKRGEAPKVNMTWALLYAIPLTMFGLVTFYTVMSSLGDSSFALPTWIIMTRGGMALAYAYISNTKINLDAGIRGDGRMHQVLPVYAQHTIAAIAPTKPVALPVINAQQPPAPPEQEPIDQSETYYSIDHGTDPNLYPLSDGANEEYTKQEQVAKLLRDDPAMRTKDLKAMGFQSGTIARGRELADAAKVK